MLKDFGEGAALRTVVRAAGRRLLEFGLAFFLGVAEALRALLAEAVRFTGVFEDIFFVLGFALALVAIFPPTADLIMEIIALLF